MRFFLLLVMASLGLTKPVSAEMSQRDGWAVIKTGMTHADLVASTRAEIKDNGLVVVPQAGPTNAAAAPGSQLPGTPGIAAVNPALARQQPNMPPPATTEGHRRSQP